MHHPNPHGEFPKISNKSWIFETALIIGNVTIEDNVFVGPNAVMGGRRAWIFNSYLQRLQCTGQRGGPLPFQFGSENRQQHVSCTRMHCA